MVVPFLAAYVIYVIHYCIHGCISDRYKLQPDRQPDRQRGHAPKRLTVGIEETTAAMDAAFTPALSPSAPKTQPLF
jgi:hypothetical protein